jgi:energy-converting hydrogenase Eha subunit E
MMSKSKADAAAGAGGTQGPPALRRGAGGRVEPASLAAVIQWFLDYDERVAVVRFPAVEALFQWRQQEELKAGEVEGGGRQQGPPTLRRGADGRVEPASLAGVIQWFLDYDERVAVVRFPAVEALFQWRREEEAKGGEEDTLGLSRAEDRLAVGVMQALVEHDTEGGLHAWIKELLAALEDARQTNEAIAEAYGLKPSEDSSVVHEAEKIPSRRERDISLNCCWLETLCTAEARVLGWAYQGLYGRAFHPENF